MTFRFHLLLLAAGVCLGQSPAELNTDPTVRAAVEAARRNEPRTVELQARLCEIPAPPYQEAARGQELQRLFQELGLRDVRVDAAGNVIGVRGGKAPRPNLVFAAHLDTVFPAGTNVQVTRAGDLLKGPGIGDNCRGLAVMLAVIGALNEAQVETHGTITFVADVGEEGLGDLRGMKSLFFDSLKGQIDKFVSVDDTGLGITHIGVGSNRYKVTFKGPGGHSYGAFGMANPIQAMGRAIAKIDALEVPRQPKTTFSRGPFGGSTSVNATPFEDWMEVDMRSADPAALHDLDTRFNAAIRQAVAEENTRWNHRGPVSASAELVGVRPAGQTPLATRSCAGAAATLPANSNGFS